MTSKNEKKKYSTEFLKTALLENSIKKNQFNISRAILDHRHININVSINNNT